MVNNQGERVLYAFLKCAKLFMLGFFITSFVNVASAATLQTEWIDQFGSVEDVYDVSYAIDSDGDIYIAGLVSGTLPGQTSAGEEDAFVRKYDSQGNILSPKDTQ